MSRADASVHDEDAAPGRTAAAESVEGMQNDDANDLYREPAEATAEPSKEGDSGEDGCGPSSPSSDNPTSAALVDSFLETYEAWRDSKSRLEERPPAAAPIPSRSLAKHSEEKKIKGTDDRGPSSSSRPFSWFGSAPPVLTAAIARAAAVVPDAPPPPSPALLERWSALLLPGARFVGEIRIPGDAGMTTRDASEGDGEKRDYEFHIVEHGTDELGNPSLLGWHRAYGDDQFVNVDVRVVMVPASNPPAVRTTLEDSQEATTWSSIAGASQCALEIEFADGETVCRGRWEAGSGRFVGQVWQLMCTADSVFLPSDNVTHTFTLYPQMVQQPKAFESAEAMESAQGAKSECYSTNHVSEDAPLDVSLLSSEHQTLADRWSEVERLRNDTLSQFLELSAVMDFADQSQRRALDRRRWRSMFRIMGRRQDGTENGGDSDRDENGSGAEAGMARLKNVSWTHLLECAGRRSERACAKFRRQASLLDGLRFDSERHKAAVLRRVKNAGLSLATAHAEWDACEAAVLNVTTAWSCFAGPSVFAQYCFPVIVCIRRRLHMSYGRLDGSYKRAEARLTETDFRRFAVPPSGGVPAQLDDAKRRLVENDGVCAICHNTMEGAAVDNPLYLPCSHVFHGECIRAWLHNHSECPMCRHNLRLGPKG